jgi:hypothetical protein
MPDPAPYITSQLFSSSDAFGPAEPD